MIAFLALSPAPLPERPLPEIDKSVWNALLKGIGQPEASGRLHLAQQGRLQRLSDYIGSLGQPGTRILSPNEKKALLVNAYNAFTIQWVVQSYD